MTVDVGGSCYFGSDPLSCLIDQWVVAFGGPNLLGLLAASLLFIGFYIASEGSVSVPAVALLLVGTVLIPALPAQYSSIATTVVFVGLAAAIFAVLQRYVLNPSTAPR